MNTKPLEQFATRARRELIVAVESQAVAALATGSVARSERAETVKRLEVEIVTHGQKYVIDKVAYTWFNRLIALRYMDACGYTSAGVVSPAKGQPHGQPEILGDAKRGHLDDEVVINTRTREAVLGLLDGTRRSTDAEGEAYALLLTEYCRFWNKAMPFMFEREGDYTELLIPSGLLADGGILSHAREVLTEAVCEDVEVIGWLYQFYISERKQEVFDGFSAKGSARKLAGREEIPAATQLFTPHWIVRYLVENSVGRLWMLNRPTSRLADKMDYNLAPVDEETDFLKISGPEELTVIDPACGSGHMLTYAFDLLYEIYEEEGYAPSEIPSLILTHNLFGTEIDPRAGALAAFALSMKARSKDRRFFNKEVAPHVCVIEPIYFEPDELDFLGTKSGDRYGEEAFWNQFRDADTLGSLIQPRRKEVQHATSILQNLPEHQEALYNDVFERASLVVSQAEVLSRTYSAVVANPPYMGSANMNETLGSWVSDKFAAGKGDLMTAFMIRAESFVEPGGLWAMINIPTWMFLGAYQKLRLNLLEASSIQSLLHLGRGVFGADFGAVAFVVESRTPKENTSGVYRKLFTEHVDIRPNEVIEAHFKEGEFGKFIVPQRSLRSLPGAQIAYWVDADTLRAFDGESITSHGVPRTGIDSGNNELHYRNWWEVSVSSIDRSISELPDPTGPVCWTYLQRGGERRRWYGNVDSVVSVGGGGTSVQNSTRPSLRNAESYFQRSVAWNRLSNGRFYPRLVDQGTAFDDGSPFAVPAEGTSVETLLGLLGSAPARRMLGLFNQGRKTEVGHVAMLPWPAREIDSGRIDANVGRLVEIAREDWDNWETSPDFKDHPARSGFGLLRGRIVAFEKRLDSLSAEVKSRELENDQIFTEAFGFSVNDAQAEVTLLGDLKYNYDGDDEEAAKARRGELVRSFVSYAIGCMFGRYSLDSSGLILADQGSSLQEYLVKVPTPTFIPNAENVVPIIDDGWFEDDIVERFRQFLRTAFGAERFEENLRFVEQSLGVKTIRDYFIAKSNPLGRNIARSKFYDDHVQRYKRRPIYWMFSSPKGSFNALIYLHRYTPATVSTVLNEYLREYRGKLEVALQRAEQAATGGASAKEQKEADRLRAVLAELRDYEHDVLFPLDLRRVEVDLDDGVKMNYPKFAPALRPIQGLGTSA